MKVQLVCALLLIVAQVSSGQQTQSPTQAPSQTPPVDPNPFEPTQSPTKQVTSSPTASPTKQVTSSPTASPTKQVTNNPTTSPTKQVTNNPTASPTKQETNSPTREPTSSPTRRSSPTTDSPTSSPTVPLPPASTSPTSSPTFASTQSPTPRQIPVTPFPTAATGTSLPTSSPTEAVEGFDSFGYVSFGLAALGSVLGVGAAGFVFVFRNRPIMRMSHRGFLAMFSLSVALVCFSLFPYVYGVFYPSATMCVVHDWVFNVSVTFSLACLVVKEWRSYRIYQSSRNWKPDHIRNETLVLYVTILIIPSMVLLGLSSFVGDPLPVPDEEREDRCTVNSFHYVLFCYMGLLAIFSVIMALVSRSVPAVGAESVGILFSSCFILFAVMLNYLIALTGQMTHSVEALLLCFSIFWSAVVALGLIVFRKAMWLDYSKEQVQGKFLRLQGTFGGSYQSAAGDSSWIETTGQSSTKRLTESSDASATATGEKSTGVKKAAIVQIPVDIVVGEEEVSGESHGDVDNTVESGIAATTGIYKEGETRSAALPSSNASTGSSTGEGQQTEKEEEVIPQDPEARYMWKQRKIIEAKKATGFHVGERAGWDRFVDRETGEEFWINRETLDISLDPFSESEIETTKVDLV